MLQGVLKCSNMYLKCQNKSWQKILDILCKKTCLQRLYIDIYSSDYNNQYFRIGANKICCQLLKRVFPHIQCILIFVHEKIIFIFGMNFVKFTVYLDLLWYVLHNENGVSRRHCKVWKTLFLPISIFNMSYSKYVCNRFLLKAKK